MRSDYIAIPSSCSQLHPLLNRNTKDRPSTKSQGLTSLLPTQKSSPARIRKPRPFSKWISGTAATDRAIWRGAARRSSRRENLTPQSRSARQSVRGVNRSVCIQPFFDPSRTWPIAGITTTYSQQESPRS
jgi:hypothetical protein